MAKNITNLYLLNVPLENDYLHTLYFGSKDQQYSYFYGKRVKSVGSGEFSYQRKDSIIRYFADYDDLVGCNYVMYQNSAYSSKWYYAFITKMEFKNDQVTEIHIETDVIQTWLFDYAVRASFVEREHTIDDTIGANTVPEQLELCEYITNKAISNKSLTMCNIVMATTVDINTSDFKNVAGSRYNGIFSGVRYYYLTPEKATSVIQALANAGKSDAINCLVLAPDMYVDTVVDGTGMYPMVESTKDGTSMVKKQNWVATLEDTPINKPTALNGYTPYNKKLLTYPYCFLRMDNNSGGSAIYHYEMFANPNNNNLCDFTIYSAIAPGMSIRIVPKYYGGVNDNVENNAEGLNLGKYPICSWNTDVYTNWLTQNSVNIGLSLGSSLIGVGSSMYTGDASGAFGGLGGIASTVAEVYQHSLMPPQAEGNLNSGDVTFSSGHLTFTAYQQSIKQEYARIIDEYFMMFGYKVNRVKVPNKDHRTRHWYTKTIDCNIDGAIPMEDLRKIKDCYNKGITFWRPNYIGTYSLANNITTT